MIISKKLTAEELDEIAHSPIVCDDDCPELTPAHFAKQLLEDRAGENPASR
jgi:hypothetical protein